MKTALIIGISGQDGAYLAQLLLEKGYQVFGTSRDAEVNSFQRLKDLNIEHLVKLFSMTPNDFRSVIQVLSKVEPDEVYNLAGQSSVGLSFELPVETMESISGGVLTLLEAIRFINPQIKFYNACSSEMLGETSTQPATEETPFRPRSPYAVAKSTAFWQTRVYRQSYGLFACSGILFNHESPLRPRRFVTRKIVSEALKVKNGESEKLVLGNLDIIRDWGWAPDYVQAMWLMLQYPEAEDFIIASGKSHSLRYFIELTFEQLGLDYQTHVVSSEELFRPNELMASYADPSKAKQLLGWNATLSFEDMVKKLVQAEVEHASQG